MKSTNFSCRVGFMAFAFVMCCLTLLGTVPLLAEAAAVKAPKKPATAVKFVGAITLDGKLDEAAWKKAPVHTGFEMPLDLNNRAPIPEAQQTSFQVLYTDTMLYVGIRCNEPDMAKLRPYDAPKWDAAMWTEDDVELFIDPVGDRNEYYQFCIDPNGVQADLYYIERGNTGKPYSADWHVGAHRDTNYWSVEIAIPFGAFYYRPSTMWADTWVFSVARTRTVNGFTTSQYSPSRYYHDVASALMVDMEYGMLSLEELRKQTWYPANGTTEQKAAFEKKYYDGYARSYTAVGEAARKQGGWDTIGIYGWQPMNKMWYGLENVNADPATYWQWNAYGKQINDKYDVIYPDVYCFYRVPQNVAFTLANIDLCMKIEKTAAKQKPLRPYYWTQLHGGDASYHWWAGQPLLDEEMRAMTAMCFFTGVDGAVSWNWSEFDNHHIAPPLMVKRNDKEVGADVMLKDGFSVKAEGAKDEDAEFKFVRYDMLHILSVSKVTDKVRFQRIEIPNPKNNFWAGDFKADATAPVYVMSKDDLLPHLRPTSEPMAAMVEGLALAKPFEYTLRHGEVKLDQDSQEVFAKTLPIVRRVKLGNTHIIATYDPTAIFGAPAREITLKDFDGHPGLVLKLPADAQTRIFVLQEE